MKCIAYDSKADSLYSWQLYNSFPTNKAKIEAMKKLTALMMKIELTEKQELCLKEYFLNEKPVKLIASEQGITRSTVYFHIKRALKKLQKCSEYINVIKRSDNE